ncbi:molybdopterin synthase sulfur carrier subunit [Ureibacillus xyleni]|uniref:Molybdopterin synthase sulfur carrier subunit n=1 Tax=Ureibacillus xyleni TaxID=614648 RepID=A0A285S4L7_9BACL|nr:molybdopterin converting factor subunit 1 [Ureibacillus xyleni]SOB99854.1 molybdopterin synthase sulfur carrier subunit [Ureibacillus xyleni]
MITLYYFAGLRDKAGVDVEQVQLTGLKVRELLEYVSNKYEGFKGSLIHIAVNEEYALLDDIVKDGDVVAFIPPVSGG